MIKRLFSRIKGFTLIETLVAISLLTVAIVAPLSLTTQSLASAYYARDQVTAFFLAQEAIEGVRAVRDNNILRTALGTPTDLMTGVPDTNGNRFTIDVRTDPPTMTLCSTFPGGICPVLQTDSTNTFYGYSSGWTNTNFRRYVEVAPIAGNDIFRVSVTVQWQTAAFEARTFTITENLYRWVYDGTPTTVVVPPVGGSALGASPSPVSPGGWITVTFTNGTTPAQTTTDWIGLYPVGSSGSGGALITWKYLNDSTTPPGAPVSSGTVTMNAPVAPGDYYFILYANDGYTDNKAESNTIRVQ